MKFFVFAYVKDLNGENILTCEHNFDFKDMTRCFLEVSTNKRKAIPLVKIDKLLAFTLRTSTLKEDLQFVFP